MRKVVVKYGLISGAIIAGLMFATLSLMEDGALNFDTGEYFGYGAMLVALSMVFFGIKSYRDEQTGRSIKFLKGVQVGLLISLVASLVYAVSWEVYLQTNAEIRETFFAKYTEHYVGKLREQGVPQDQIERVRADMTAMGELYKNPLIRFGMTLAEILPLGIVVTMLSAAILRRKEVLAE
ncbi:MAG: DUF4199 domain-containing protein [Pyrinomonadaceae bacterium]